MNDNFEIYFEYVVQGEPEPLKHLNFDSHRVYLGLLDFEAARLNSSR